MSRMIIIVFENFSSFTGSITEPSSTRIVLMKINKSNRAFTGYSVISTEIFFKKQINAFKPL